MPKRLILSLALLSMAAAPLVSAQAGDDVAVEADVAVDAEMAAPAPEVTAEAGMGLSGVSDVDDNSSVSAEPPASSGLLGDEQIAAERALGIDEGRSTIDPYEDPVDTYMFLGLFYRHNWTPGFMLGLFLDEYTAADNSAFGLEFTYRKDGFDIITSLYYQGFGVNGPFRGPGDPNTETEIIDSDMFGLMVSVDLMWGTQINDWFGIQYGLGIGLGGIFGDLSRTETREDGSACNGSAEERSSSNGPSSGWCDNVSDEITGTSGVAQKWFDGGSVPNLYFRFAVPHIALRFKPIHQLLIRVDGGFDIFSGFFAGGALAYGF